MDIAKGYQENEELMAGMDSVYGSGSAKYTGEAIESFYTTPGEQLLFSADYCSFLKGLREN